MKINYVLCSFLLGTTESVVAFDKLQMGDHSCPCVSAEQLGQILSYGNGTMTNSKLESGQMQDDFILSINLTTYGIGCKAHDKKTSLCTKTRSSCETIFPPPRDCDNSWCEFEWCYVDDQHCDVRFEPSVSFAQSGRFYSYAACGNMNRFVNEERLKKIENRTFRVGFVKNSGGWKGAYSDKGDFDVTNSWDGPTVRFIEQAALEGKFNVNRTAPPAWLKEKATMFFNSTGAFDYCVYVTSLGYIDFCVGIFSITDKRIAAGTFWKIYSEPLYLVVFQNDGESWSTFWDNVWNVFKPFTKKAWFFIVFFVIPFLSLSIAFHEHEKFPKHFDLSKICESLYWGFDSLFQAAWPREGHTVSGRLTILGMGFFILTIIAAYTANLAAMLTENARLTNIESIDDAIAAGYNFCASRNQASSLIKTLDLSSHIVVNSIESGGDGLPGFLDRFQVLDSMKKHHNDPSKHCNAAIVAMEDMDEMNANGLHCNKTIVGRPLSYMDKGIPVNKLISEEIVHHFQVMLNKDTFEKIITQTKPESSCPSTAEDGMSLNVVQLSGIWVISFSFALIGFLLRIYSWSTKICVEKPSLPNKSVGNSITDTGLRRSNPAVSA